MPRPGLPSTKRPLGVFNMFLPVWVLVTASIAVLALAAALIYACRLAYKHTQYNLKLFTQLLEEKASNEALAAQVLRLQGRKPERKAKSQFHN
jgi:cell division protein FtsL